MPTSTYVILFYYEIQYIFSPESNESIYSWFNEILHNDMNLAKEKIIFSNETFFILIDGLR